MSTCKKITNKCQFVKLTKNNSIWSSKTLNLKMFYFWTLSIYNEHKKQEHKYQNNNLVYHNENQLSFVQLKMYRVEIWYTNQIHKEQNKHKIKAWRLKMVSLTKIRNLSSWGSRLLWCNLDFGHKPQSSNLHIHTSKL